MASYISVGSEPTATDKIPCGDRDGVVTFPWVRNPPLLTRSPAGIGIGVVTFPFGTTASDKIPCGDRDGWPTCPWVRNRATID
jgi:hypothetical protein